MSWSKSLLLVASVLATASAAAADELIYPLQGTSFFRMVIETNVVVTFTPPLGEPITETTLVSSTLTSPTTGSGTADVGIPGYFAGGEHGLLLSAFDAHTDFTGIHTLLTNLFDDIVPLLPAPPPIPLVGAVLFVDYADLDVNLMGPLQSSLISIGPDDPNVYYWGGVAPIQLSGSLNLKVSIPGQEDPIPFEPVPFGPQTLDGALAGSFTGDAATTVLVVGLEDAALAPDTIPTPEPVVIDLTPLGSISVVTQRMRLAVNGNVRGVNSEYALPPPLFFRGSGSSCGIGPELAALLPVLGWLRRWRQRRG